jgi:two-component system LytT family sensor kinase
MQTALGVVLGSIITVALFAGGRLLSGSPRVLSPQAEAMRAAVHAATATLPYLRTGLTRESASHAIDHLHALTQAPAVAIADGDAVLALAGTGGEHLPVGNPLPPWLAPGRDDRLHVEPKLRERMPSLPFDVAVVVPLMVRERRAGSLIALYESDERLRPEDTRVITETAALVAAQLELAEVEAQEKRLARAELRALRAQISPHFIYNALAAVASLIRTRPQEARELLTEFAEFTRYAFRGQRPYVTLADELRYVEKYLRLEQARFGERLEVRVSVAPEVLAAVVPALSLQPLVENAIRHGVEAKEGRCRLEIVGADLDADVELCVRDDGPGMDASQVRRALAGQADGIGLANVNARLQATFGAGYGLELASRPGVETTVRMTVPKFRAGVRAA